MGELPKEVLDRLNGKRIEDAAIGVMYRNYRGEIGLRRIFPLEVFYGKNEYHKEEQWLLKVWDLEKNAYREYAMKDIIEWKFDN